MSHQEDLSREPLGAPPGSDDMTTRSDLPLTQPVSRYEDNDDRWRTTSPRTTGDYIGEGPVMRLTSDRVRWGPIWAGVVITVAVFVLAQLALFATDAISLDINPGGGTSYPLWTVLAAILAFLVGGLVAGATARWKSLDDGLIQGIVMWAITSVGLLLLSSIALGNLTSSFGGALARLATLRDEITSGSTTLDPNAVDDARTVAAQACLLLGLTLVASAVGALIGARLWPRRRHLAEAATATGPVAEERRSVRA
jgi:hypothetical protein